MGGREHWFLSQQRKARPAHFLPPTTQTIAYTGSQNSHATGRESRLLVLAIKPGHWAACTSLSADTMCSTSLQPSLWLTFQSLRILRGKGENTKPPPPTFPQSPFPALGVWCRHTNCVISVFRSVRTISQLSYHTSWLYEATGWLNRWSWESRLT